MKALFSSFLLLIFFYSTSVIRAQQASTIASYLVDKSDLKAADLEGLVIDQNLTNKKLGVQHLYFSQTHQGLRILNAQGTAAVRIGSEEIVSVKSNFRAKSKLSFPSSQPGFALRNAVSATLQTARMSGEVSVNHVSGSRYLVEIIDGDFAHTTKAELGYYIDREDLVHLAWNFDVEWKDGSHWYSYFIDANNGSEIVVQDWQVSCNHSPAQHGKGATECANFDALLTPLDGSGYRVFPFPVESPNHGGNSIINEPGLQSASPFGWHDTNGSIGSEFTITRGNNVYAYEDAGDNNSPGFSPDGGAGLSFDYPYTQSQGPASYQSASITNLFYANNRIHDILAVYGFDEVSGNFQATNYSGEGSGNDFVRAEAQDGGGSNNANMATPAEGSNPRMQMYLWTASAVSELFTINAPSPLAGTYASSAVAAFGPQLPAGGITADAIYVNDGSGDPLDGCQSLINSGVLAGKIALVNRGSCTFVEKILFAQEAGAIACVVVNNTGGLIALGGASSDITIPSLMITQALGAQILASLNGSNTVNVTLNNSGSSNLLDGSFDNGIVIHEYVHGLSNRLTGGSQAAGCLQNEEQMGEGWSDWYALMLTMDLSISNPVFRPMGTFASGEGTQGNGIRPVPYDTNFAVNSFTYANVSNANLSVPHGVGFVWSTMLWDLTWALINEYGFDADLDAGVAGNNIALQLVTEGLKLQGCNPGFVDGRDGILLADELLYNGANRCLIWSVFAKRGLGFSADQGSPDSRADGTAAFDVSPLCLPVDNPPIAAFSISSSDDCLPTRFFVDESIETPQFWAWDFGDGNTSEEPNPVHTYAAPGSYVVSLTVSNTLGENTFTQSEAVVYEPYTDPQVDQTEFSGCAGDVITFSASSAQGIASLYNSANQLVSSGGTISLEIGAADSSYTLYAEDNLFPSENVGPVDGAIGNGTNHNTQFTGTVDFSALQPLRINRAWVVSGAIGTRTITLWDDASGEGNVLAQRTVSIDFVGGGWISLDFEIAIPGVYSMGLNNANLFRNNGGVEYPYNVDGLISIFGSSAGPESYYYFYNIEVDPLECRSEGIEINTVSLGNAQFTAFQDDLTVTFSPNDLSANSYQWSFGDGQTSTDQIATHTYAVLGMYDVTLETDGNCSFESTIDLAALSTESQEKEGWLVFPNPTSDQLYITNNAGKLSGSTIQLIDVRGSIVQNVVVQSEGRTTISTQNLANGLYTLMIQNSDQGLSLQYKIVVAH